VQRKRAIEANQSAHARSSCTANDCAGMGLTCRCTFLLPLHPKALFPHPPNNDRLYASAPPGCIARDHQVVVHQRKRRDRGWVSARDLCHALRQRLCRYWA
jgi:hypothetical protein